jgi:hypothetical protein
MANNSDSFPWPVTAINMLRKYWADNASASYIAGRINAEFKACLTRNAVIGKAARLGLRKTSADVKRARASSGRTNGKKNAAAGKTHAWTPEAVAKAVRARKAKAAIRREERRAAEGVQPDPRRQKPATPPPPRIPTVHVSTITGAIIPGPSPIPPQPIPAPAAVTGQPITIFEITAHNCCWPINAGRPQWLFCGCPRDPKSGVDRERGYCTAHWRKSVSGRAA